MPRGGARPGAGRPKKGSTAPTKVNTATKCDKPEAAAQSTEPTPDVDKSTEPLEYLLSVMRDPKEDKRIRLQAASLAAPYMHAKPAVGGKRAAAQGAAAKAGGGRFGPGAPPLRVVGAK